MKNVELVLSLPEWLRDRLGREDRRLGSIEDRVRFVIELARENIERRTGGPFGAAVFEAESGRLISAGVNLVELSHCSIAHAEMIAIGTAQQVLGRYALGADGQTYELATSTEPCAMCLGAIPWSGLQRVVCGAYGEDAGAIGFDEGAKPDDWVGALRQRGIEVVRDVLRKEAQAVLQQYAASGGLIYNAQRGR